MMEKRINRVTAREKWQSYLNHPMALVQFLLVHLAALITAAVVLFLIAYVLITGVPHIHKELFAWTWTTENQSMMPALVNTLVMTLLSLLIAVPIGVCAAIYMVEYAKRGNKLVKLVRLTAETLQGIPSIVYVSQDSFRTEPHSIRLRQYRTNRQESLTRDFSSEKGAKPQEYFVYFKVLRTNFWRKKSVRIRSRICAVLPKVGGRANFLFSFFLRDY